MTIILKKKIYDKGVNPENQPPEYTTKYNSDYILFC